MNFNQKHLEKLWKRNGFVFQWKPLWFDEKNLAKNDAKKRCEKFNILGPIPQGYLMLCIPDPCRNFHPTFWCLGAWGRFGRVWSFRWWHTKTLVWWLAREWQKSRRLEILPKQVEFLQKSMCSKMGHIRWICPAKRPFQWLPWGTWPTGGIRTRSRPGSSAFQAWISCIADHRCSASLWILCQRRLPFPL